MKVMNTANADAPKIKFVIAAEAGNGKTTLAKTLQQGLDEKVIVVSAEAGLLSLAGSAIDFVELQREWSEEKKSYIEIAKTDRINRLVRIYQWLMLPETMAKYKWIFVDSLTEINQNMFDMLDSMEDFSGPKNTIKKYGELTTRMLSLCKTFRDMPHYEVVFSALVKTEKDSDNLDKMKISMTGAFAEKLPALFDEVFYLGVTNEIGDDNRNKRLIQTQKTDKIEFPKDRSGKLARFEPADLSVIVKKIRQAPLLGDISTAAKAAATEHKTLSILNDALKNADVAVAP